MKFFKPEDFNGNTHEWENSKFVRVEYAANICNAKLEREGRVVFGGKYCLGGEWSFVSHLHGEGTHKALLINIEPIEKCKHPREKVYYKFGQGLKLQEIQFPGPQKYEPGHWICECGIKVQASAFEEIK